MRPRTRVLTGCVLVRDRSYSGHATSYAQRDRRSTVADDRMTHEEPPLVPLLPRRVRFTHCTSAGSLSHGWQHPPSPRITLEDNSGDRATRCRASGATGVSWPRHISRNRSHAPPGSRGSDGSCMRGVMSKMTVTHRFALLPKPPPKGSLRRKPTLEQCPSCHGKPGCDDAAGPRVRGISPSGRSRACSHPRRWCRLLR